MVISGALIAGACIAVEIAIIELTILTLPCCGAIGESCLELLGQGGPLADEADS